MSECARFCLMGQGLRIVVNIAPDQQKDVTYAWQMYMHLTEQSDHSILQSWQDQHSEQGQNLHILYEQRILSKPCAMLQVQVMRGEGMAPDQMRRLVVHCPHAV